MCKDVADEVGLPRPAAVAAATDVQARRFFALAKRQLSDLARAHLWQAVRRQGSFTTTSSGDQGLLTSIAADLDLSRFTQDAMVNRTTRWVIGGPLTGPEYQRMQAFPVTFLPSFTIFNGHLYMSPATTSGQSVYFEYPSAYWALSGGTVAKPTFTVDTDTNIFDDYLMTLGLKWRVERQLGQDSWPASEQEYQAQVFKMAAQDGGGKRTLNAGGDESEGYPSAIVPETWSGVS